MDLLEQTSDLLKIEKELITKRKHAKFARQYIEEFNGSPTKRMEVFLRRLEDKHLNKGSEGALMFESNNEMSTQLLLAALKKIETDILGLEEELRDAAETVIQSDS